MTAEIWCDGAAVKKPQPGSRQKILRGPAGAGYVIKIEGRDPITGSEALGKKTNNEAEYHAVLLALTEAAKEGSHPCSRAI